MPKMCIICIANNEKCFDKEISQVSKYFILNITILFVRYETIISEPTAVNVISLIAVHQCVECLSTLHVEDWCVNWYVNSDANSPLHLFLDHLIF